jgi:hypothetical protein
VLLVRHRRGWTGGGRARLPPLALATTRATLVALARGPGVTAVSMGPLVGCCGGAAGLLVC